MSEPCVAEVALHRLRLPLTTPYRLSCHTFEAFEPLLVVLRDDSGRSGFGEGHVAPGSGAETPAGAWAFCRAHAPRLVGATPSAAKAALAGHLADSPVAATALTTALEMLADHPLLRVETATRLPLLTPFNALAPDAVAAETEQRLAQGFRTFKIKVGQDVDRDLARLRAIQQAVGGRATLRLDANCGFSRADGCRFAATLDPTGIELFEQPCAAADWDANAAVAKASVVPLMLDEPICSIADVERAATLDGVGLCKLKLKRFGGLDRLRAALARVRELGMEPVLGDGLSAEPCCWMEACVARSTIRNAGELNGFLKPRAHLFREPLAFADGALRLTPGRPALDPRRLAELTVESRCFVV